MFPFLQLEGFLELFSIICAMRGRTSVLALLGAMALLFQHAAAGAREQVRRAVPVLVPVPSQPPEPADPVYAQPAAGSIVVLSGVSGSRRGADALPQSVWRPTPNGPLTIRAGGCLAGAQEHAGQAGGEVCSHPGRRAVCA